MATSSIVQTRILQTDGFRRGYENMRRPLDLRFLIRLVLAAHLAFGGATQFPYT